MSSGVPIMVTKPYRGMHPMTGAGVMDWIDKGINAFQKGKEIAGKVGDYVSSEDFNNVRNGVNGVLGLAGLKNPNSATLYPNEKHAVVLSGEYKGSNYNFLGTGTRIRERLMRGDKPINDVDEVAMKQCIAYTKARTGADIRRADEAAVRGWERCSDDPTSAAIAIRTIKLKMAGETGIHLDLGLDPMLFNGPQAPIYKEEVGTDESGSGRNYPAQRLREYAKAHSRRHR